MENKNEAIYMLAGLRWLIHHELGRTKEMSKLQHTEMAAVELEERLEALKTMREYIDEICEKINDYEDRK